MNSDLYQDHILDHARNPRQYGALSECSFAFPLANPLCGDTVELFVNVSSEGMVTDMTFQGQGCVISQAAASLFCEAMRQQSIEQATESFALKLIGNALNPARRPCALQPRLHLE